MYYYDKEEKYEELVQEVSEVNYNKVFVTIIEEYDERLHILVKMDLDVGYDVGDLGASIFGNICKSGGIWLDERNDDPIVTMIDRLNDDIFEITGVNDIFDEDYLVVADLCEN